METSASAGCLDTKPAKVCSACVIRGADVHGALGQLVELRVGVDEQVAHLGKVGGLGIEGVVSLPTGGDDFDEHLAALRLGLRDGVIQALLQGKGLLQRGGGVVHRAGKRAGALRAELGRGDVELLLAAADGFVGGDQLFAGQLLQGLGGKG